MNTQKIMFLLEDNKVLIENLEEIFREDGFVVKCFQSEKSFRDFIQLVTPSDHPSIIVLDIMMPLAELTLENFELYADKLEPSKSAGLRIAKDIKLGKYPAIKGVPLVFYTILNREDFKREAANLGIRYFVKGEDPIDTLRRYILKLTE